MGDVAMKRTHITVVDFASLESPINDASCRWRIRFFDFNPYSRRTWAIRQRRSVSLRQFLQGRLANSGEVEAESEVSNPPPSAMGAALFVDIALTRNESGLASFVTAL